jgi:predicted ATPase
MVPLPIPPARLIEEEVERLAASDALRRAPGHQRLLHYLVAKRLAGDEAALRETAIALDVFRRDPATYDPQVDPIVRVNIGRLRERLEAHYANFDRTPKLRIVLPRGRYAPDFVAESDPPASLPGLQAAPVLPAYLTRCFGVERQVARIRERLTANRLVTLLGPGGSGKTRLAVELARAVRDAPAAGDDGAAPAFDVVAFVPLAACADLPAMQDALRGAFALPASPVGVVEQLARTLAGRRALLVLDNLEQLLPLANDPVRALLAALPRLHVLATSRIVLGQDGECECPISPLAQPAPDATWDEMAASPALALFVDRAASVRTDFRLGPDNAAQAAEIVRTLGGLPLAIELAASRVRSFTPDQILHRLRGVAEGAPPGRRPGLSLLERKGVRDDGDPRHASMEQVIGWSWAQLDATQQRTLEAITVFPAGCDADAAFAVTEDADVALVIDELVQRSLLSVRAQRDGSLRFVITEPVREFAHSRLDRARWLELRARQRRWCLDWAAGLGVTPPLGAIHAEMPNVLAALASAVADAAPEDALRLAAAMRPALNEVPLPPSGTALLRKAIAAGGDDALRAAACTVLCVATYDQGRHADALRDAEQGLALAAPASLERARALHAVASLRWRTTRDAHGLDPLLDEALAIAGRLGHVGVEASVHALRGFIAGARNGGDAEAETLQRRALALWEQQGNRHLVNSGHYNLAVRAAARRAWRDCLDRLEGVCAVAREDRDWSQLSQALNVRGNAFCGLRDWPAAHAAYVEAAEVAFAAADGIALCHALWNAPVALAHLRVPATAAQVMAFAAHDWQAHYGVLSATDWRELRHVRRLVQVQLGATRREVLEDEGRRLTPFDVVHRLRAAMT